MTVFIALACTAVCLGMLMMHANRQSADGQPSRQQIAEARTLGIVDPSRFNTEELEEMLDYARLKRSAPGTLATQTLVH